MSSPENGGPSAEAGPVVVRNQAEAAVPVAAPRRGDDQPWRYEMIFDSGSWRAYADTPEALLAALIPGYPELGDDEAAKARIRLACDAQVRAQAGFTAAGDLDRCSEEQRELLLGDFSAPPTVERWDAAVPLVLVRSFYKPEGAIPPPAGDNIVWLDPSSEWTLLLSLAQTGMITVAEADAA